MSGSYLHRARPTLVTDVDLHVWDVREFSLDTLCEGLASKRVSD